MALPITDKFPPIRACIFDMDGLLINSEDSITQSINQLLKEYLRPPFTVSIRARIMGIPGSTNGDVFHNWAQSREQFAVESSGRMHKSFVNCEPLPGAEKLLLNLSHARSTSLKDPIELALASSTGRHSYELKTTRPETKQLLDIFAPNKRILGDDTRVSNGRGKPAPDIFLAALDSINSALDPDQEPILPEQCLVFEDSVIGVEAGRRAGMRLIWVPHADLAVEYQDKQALVLAGRTGLIDVGDSGQLGEINDGWAERIQSLEQFNYEKYGINIRPDV